MTQVFSFGAEGTFAAAFNHVLSWRLYEGVDPFTPNPQHDSAVLFFDDDPVKTWIVIEAVKTLQPEQKSYIFRTISVDPVIRPHCPGISVHVIPIPTFDGVLSELEDWFSHPDSSGSEVFGKWADVVKGLSVLA